MASSERSDDRAASPLGRWREHPGSDPADRAPDGLPDRTEDEERSPVVRLDEVSARRNRSLPRHAALSRRTGDDAPDGDRAGREVLDALEVTAAEPTLEAAPGTEPVAESGVPAGRGSSPAPGSPAPPARAATSMPKNASPARRGGGGGQPGPADVVFPPRTGLARITSLLLLALVAATVLWLRRTYEDQTTFNLSVLGVLGVTSLCVYGVRAAATPTLITIRNGQLTVERAGHRETFDLSSRYTRVQVVGRPGRRGWKVLLGRFGRDPLVVDASMVDPVAFTEAIQRFRP